MKNASRKNIRNKLTYKVPMSIVSSVAAVMIVICIFLGVFLSESKQKAVTNEINYLAENNAYKVTSYLNNMQTLSKYLSDEVTRYEALNSDTRSMLIRKTLGSFLDDSRIFSAYVALEPNTLFENTPDGLSFYEYRDGSGTKLDALNDFNTYKDKDYYVAAKKSLKAYITEPYQKKLSSGKTVWLITISNPILNGNGEFIGVSNTDILTDTINGLSYNKGSYQTSYSYIVTGQSNYVIDTADKKKTGSKYLENSDGSVFKVSRPLTVDGIDSRWSCSFVVQKAEALNEIYIVLICVCTFGIIGILVIAAIIFSLIRKSLSPIGSIVQLSRNMGNGILESGISVKTNDELGELAQISQDTSQQLSGYIHEISGVLGRISDGDLKVEVQRDYLGDFAPIKSAMLTIIESLNNAFSEIEITAQQVSVGAGEIASGAQVLSQGATQQAGDLEELSGTIKKITNRVKENAEHADHAGVLAKDAQDNLEAGKQIVEEMLQAINQIGESSSEITKINKTVNDIAFQTNILALNAAVEAARAGSAGRGFAVVANEVRNLAGQSAKAAKNTTILIEQCILAVKNGTKIAGKTADLLNVIVDKSTQVNELVKMIASASNEQAVSIEKVETSVSQISTVVQTNSATAEESAAAAEELSAQADLLREKVSMFQLKNRAGTGKPENTDSVERDYGEYR